MASTNAGRSGAAFFVEPECDPPRAIVTVLGEIDLASRPDLASCLQEAIASEVHTVTLELSGVSFIDLTGIEPIIEFHQECEDRGVAIRLVASPAVDKVVGLLKDLGGLPLSLGGEA
jgi:anti-sigma B factor antagonist